MISDEPPMLAEIQALSAKETALTLPAFAVVYVAAPQHVHRI